LTRIHQKKTLITRDEKKEQEKVLEVSTSHLTMFLPVKEKITEDQRESSSERAERAGKLLLFTQIDFLLFTQMFVFDGIAAESCLAAVEGLSELAM
jgi:hypothetical protein